MTQKRAFKARRTIVDCARVFPRYVTEREAWENLANAVIVQAVVDYQCLLMSRPPLYTSGRMGADKLSETDCEIFFRSQYYAALTDVPGEYIIEVCKRRALK